MNATQIGREVERLRRTSGLTQGALAALIGTTQAAISKIETGRTLPSLTILERIANATGIPLVLTLGEREVDVSRSERKRRIRRVLGSYEFDPWERDPSPAEAESLLRDGLTRERFRR